MIRRKRSPARAVKLMSEAKLEALRADIREGLNSGPGKPAEEVLSRLERKYMKARERRAR
jgi:hypothetical protein